MKKKSTNNNSSTPTIINYSKYLKFLYIVLGIMFVVIIAVTIVYLVRGNNGPTMSPTTSAPFGLMIAGGANLSGPTISSGLAYSTNGTSWISIPSTNNLFQGGYMYRGASNSSSFVVGGVSETNTLAYSPDGINNWIGLGNTVLQQCFDVIWTGSEYMACGGSLVSGPTQGQTVTVGALAFSQDGQNWQKINSVAFNQFSFFFSIAVGNNITFLGGQPYNSGGSTIIMSNNLLTWTVVDQSTPLYQVNNFLSYFNNTLYSSGNAISSGASINYSTTNASTWIPVSNSSSLISNVVSIAFNKSTSNPIYVAVGNAGSCTVAYSNDGINFTPVDTAVNFFVSGTSVIWNGNVFIITGFQNIQTTLNPNTNTAYYSSNGINWTLISSLTSLFPQYTFSCWNNIPLT